MKTEIKQAWTPGPWAIAPDRYVLSISAAKRGVCILETKPLTGSAEVAANAKLISKCPTMAAYILKKAEEGDAEAQAIASEF